MIRRLPKGSKVRFDEINNILVDQKTRRVVFSNNYKIKPGHLISADLQKECISMGWNPIHRNPYLMTRTNNG